MDNYRSLTVAFGYRVRIDGITCLHAQYPNRYLVSICCRHVHGVNYILVLDFFGHCINYSLASLSMLSRCLSSNHCIYLMHLSHANHYPMVTSLKFSCVQLHPSCPPCVLVAPLLSQCLRENDRLVRSRQRRHRKPFEQANC